MNTRMVGNTVINLEYIVYQIVIHREKLSKTNTFHRKSKDERRKRRNGTRGEKGCREEWLLEGA